MNRINVFILSAGLGERLRPITDYIPKPLIPILGKPILEIIFEKLSSLSINSIGINLHHKRAEIEGWIDRSIFKEKISIFREEHILGTGGALKNAEVLLRECTFLVHNSDILSDIDLEGIINSHLSSGNIGTLAVRDHNEINNVVVDQSGTFIGVRSLFQNSTLNQVQGKTLSPQSLSGHQDSKMVTFTGISVYSPEFLEYLPEGKSSVVDGWQRAIASGYKIGTIDVSGSYWKDIGTPEAYVTALLNRLGKEGERIFIHPTAKVKEDAWFDGYVVIEKECMIDKGVSLKNCIMLPGSCAETKDNPPSPPHPPLTKGGQGGVKGGMGGLFENCIIGPGYTIKIDSFQSVKSLIGTGGSDRNYYRIKSDTGSAVLMETKSDDPDFERHIEYSKFFKKHSIPIPALIEADHNAKTALFEDLGDLSLYSWLKCPREEKAIEAIYRRVIDILVSIHTTLISHVSECPLLVNRIFDYEHLRWETSYLIERFLKGVRKFEVKNIAALEEEFHRLALKVDSFPKTVVHRDFQSQNIMIQKGGIPRLVDYQGARIGPPAYDLVSILWDPYYRLWDDLRNRLIDYYIDKRETIPPSPPLAKGGWGDFQVKAFRETLLPCRLQRHMQALGAYGFLSMVKGKKYFLKHVPEGLRLLKEDVSLAKDEYPELYRLVSEL